MPYPFPRPRKRLFSGIIPALLATCAKGAVPPENFGDCARSGPHISPDFALYLRDTSPLIVSHQSVTMTLNRNYCKSKSYALIHQPFV
jgi:hypothetical protein